MRILTILTATTVAAVLALPASAQTFSGPGGPLNALGTGGTGGGGNSADTLPTAWSEFPATSAVPMGAPSISNVTLTDLNHTWSGDLQIVLEDPNGVGYNLVVRLGVVAPANCCGFADDWGGDYTWLPTGDPAINQAWPLAAPGITIPSGSYEQENGTLWGGGWNSGSDNVFNMDLASIPVVPGIWTLFIYDGAAGDTGDLFGGWSMTLGGGPGPGSNYCTSNVNSTGSASTVSATGSTSVASNNIVLTSNNLANNTFGFFLTSMTQGFTQNPGGSMGDLCLGGSIGRYVGPGQIQNSGATSEISLALDLTATPTPTGIVSIAAGETWNFQSWNRDAIMGVATSNFSDGYSITFTM